MDGVTQQVYYSFITMSMLLVTHSVIGARVAPPSRQAGLSFPFSPKNGLVNTLP